MAVETTKAPRRRRTWSIWALAGWAVVAAVACEPPAPRTVSMRVDGAMGDATVTIDDMYIGNFSFVKQRGVALPPGKHRITVEREGYFPWDTLVEVKEGDPPVQLNVEMNRIPD